MTQYSPRKLGRRFQCREGPKSVTYNCIQTGRSNRLTKTVSYSSSIARFAVCGSGGIVAHVTVAKRDGYYESVRNDCSMENTSALAERLPQRISRHHLGRRSRLHRSQLTHHRAVKPGNSVSSDTGCSNSRGSRRTRSPMHDHGSKLRSESLLGSGKTTAYPQACS